MRILMLGNSFTYYNDMPKMLAKLTGAEVVANTRGGAHLAEHLNPETELGQKTLPMLENEKWDYVVLQEQSNAPATHTDAFLKSASALCEKIRRNGAMPVMYATWAYRDNTEKLASVGMTYNQMYERMHAAYALAAAQNGAKMADVGTAFKEWKDYLDVYMPDDYHPSAAGSLIAAQVIAKTIMKEGTFQ